MDHVAVRLKNISKNFLSREVFRNLDLEIKSNQFISLVGKSGCGKSTLLRLIAELEAPSTGSLEVFPPFKNSLGYVFQDPQLLPWKNTFENVLLPFTLGTPQSGFSTQEKFEKVLAALKKVHLDSHADLFPHELSGGMKMRVSLARALVREPRLLLLDEPFAALDETTRFEMQDQLLELWHEEKLTIIFVTHSLTEAAYLSERVLLLQGQDSTKWSDLRLDLPGVRTQDLRTSPALNSIVKDLSTRLRA